MKRNILTYILLPFLLLDAAAAPETTAKAPEAPARISLDGSWTLNYWQQGPTPVRGPSQTEGLGWDTIPATVPGNVELDLYAVGLIPDPVTDSNIYRLEPWETYQWRYSRMFATPAHAHDDLVYLHFEGIDCFADIWLNGRKVGETDNMLIPHEFEVSGLLAPEGGENQLEVYLRSSVIEGRKYVVSPLSRNSPKPESIHVRRAPHTYGWDILPRLVSAGLWRSVSLEIRRPSYLTDVWWYTARIDTAGRSAEIYLDYSLHTAPDFHAGALDAAYSLSRNGKVCAAGELALASHCGRIRIPVDDVEFWWPRGLGDSPLYDAVFTLKDKDGRILDEKRSRLGIRTVALDRTPVHSKSQPGRFVFLVNGEPVFIKGSNWTPMDAFHSRDPQHLERTFGYALDLNCNMLRCWGGNVYEDHAFYDLCDENGILVWQDFSMGCTQYPQDPDFQRAIYEEVTAVVRKLRGHPCIALWSGNNENDASTRWSMKPFDADPNQDIVSRQTIPAALFDCDPSRPYLPSSPYYSPEVVALGFDPHALPEDHLWGPRGYYKDSYYTGATCLFASETGYHGMPCRESLEQMFSPDNVYPWSDTLAHTWKDPWLTKSVRVSATEGYTPKRNDLMINQVRLIFGEVPSDLDRFITASQAVQGEALKYFIERFRGAKFAPRTGILWWNIRDGWPLISDAVVDWYNRPKAAYDYIKRCQTDVCVMVTDDGADRCTLVAVNDTRQAVDGRVEVTDAASGRRIWAGNYTTEPNGRAVLTGLPAARGQGMWIIRYTDAEGRDRVNHYLYGKIPFRLDDYLAWRDQIR